MRATTTLGVMTLLCSCDAAPDEMVPENPVDLPPQPQKLEPAPPAPVADAPKIICDMSKFSFTQELGCVNDGWVEFCAEKAGAPVVTTLRAIAPDVSITEGSIGRAGCNEAMEYLVSLPVREADCMAKYGALTDAAWNTLCALSQVKETKHFVPGFAE
jgi:hypothetical protein